MELQIFGTFPYTQTIIFIFYEKVIFLSCLMVENTNLICRIMFDSIKKKKKLISTEIIARGTSCGYIYVHHYENGSVKYV